MNKLTSKIVRLAYYRPELRSDLLPLLRKIAKQNAESLGRTLKTLDGGVQKALLKLPYKDPKKMKPAVISIFDQLSRGGKKEFKALMSQLRDRVSAMDGADVVTAIETFMS